MYIPTDVCNYILKYLEDPEKYVIKAVFHKYLDDIFPIKYQEQEIIKNLNWDKIADHGWLFLIKLFHKLNISGCTEEAMDYAAKNGHLEIIT